MVASAAGLPDGPVVFELRNLRPSCGPQIPRRMIEVPMRAKPIGWIPALILLGAGVVPGFAAEKPTRGGILHVALRAEPKTFNPFTAIDAPSRDVLRRIHTDLIGIDRSTQKTVPSLAESWSRSSDGTRYTLKLRRGVR